MESFKLFVKLGLDHVLDFNAYDHILFLVALAVVYTFKDWKKVLWLITFFTIGHTLTLALSAYKILNIDIKAVEFLIPVTILVTAASNILTFKGKTVSKSNINLVFVLFFGLIHGLGFSNYFRMIIQDVDSKFLPLLEFALGIELAQVIIVLGILLISFAGQTVFKISKRDWVFIVSAIVLGITIPMLAERKFW